MNDGKAYRKLVHYVISYYSKHTDNRHFNGSLASVSLAKYGTNKIRI